jgi:glycosyl transferase family 9 (putative heptosyltransferase)
LPALKALRVAHPKAGIEILGYPHITSIADKRFYADAVRSIEYAALSRFFARGAELPPELRDYFAGFDLILSYLYDPDRIFEENLRRCGAERILQGPAKVLPGMHAARQLAEPLQQLGINVTELAAKIYPSDADMEFARGFLNGLSQPIFAIHPGSGSEKKNWPIENYLELVTAVLNGAARSRSGCLQTADLSQGRLQSRLFSFSTILIVSGEADQNVTQRLRSSFEGESRLRFAQQLPLPQLAAILSQTTFIGHDSGISHLAAAAGARSVILFGPTDPNLWAPQNNDVTVLLAPSGDLTQLAVTTVLNAITH